MTRVGCKIFSLTKYREGVVEFIYYYLFLHMGIEGLNPKVEKPTLTVEEASSLFEKIKKREFGASKIHDVIKTFKEQENFEGLSEIVDFCYQM
jgi:hypothetical protein